MRPHDETGLNLAIYELGICYSNRNYLRQFPAREPKCNRSCARNFLTNSDDVAITTAIANKAKALHLRVIIEGVEIPSQLSLLQSSKCDQIQGYYFRKILVPADAADTLRREAIHVLSTRAGAALNQDSLCRS